MKKLFKSWKAGRGDFSVDSFHFCCYQGQEKKQNWRTDHSFLILGPKLSKKIEKNREKGEWMIHRALKNLNQLYLGCVKSHLNIRLLNEPWLGYNDPAWHVLKARAQDGLTLEMKGVGLENVSHCWGSHLPRETHMSTWSRAFTPVTALRSCPSLKTS